MSDGGKGSNPRPFSVDQKTFESNWELAFGKKEPKVIDDAKAEDEAFKHAQTFEEYRKQAQELWFQGGGCTGGKPE
jgi:hypothetical protein